MKCFCKCFDHCFSISVDKEINEVEKKEPEKIEIKINDKPVDLGPSRQEMPPIIINVAEKSIEKSTSVNKSFDPEIIDKSVTPRPNTPSSEPLSDDENPKVPKNVVFSDCEEYEYV